jgi:hypothetical protein
LLSVILLTVMLLRRYLHKPDELLVHGVPVDVTLALDVEELDDVDVFEEVLQDGVARLVPVV